MKRHHLFFSLYILIFLTGLAKAADEYPLHESIRNLAPTKEVFALLSLYDVNQKDNITNTPLHYASQQNSLRLVRLLIQQGADTNSQNALGYTPLMLAVRKNKNLRIINELAKSTSLNMQNSFGFTALHVAINHPKAETIIKTLIRYEANPNLISKNGHTPFILALKERMPFATVDALNNQTAQNHEDYFGAKAAHWAAYSAQDARWIRLFKDSSTMLHVTNHGRNVLHYFAEGNNKLSVLQALIQKHSSLDINRPDQFGKTPLMLYALHGNNIKTLKFMIEKGANTDSVSNEGLTPLMYAARYNQSAKFITELAKHSDVQFRNKTNHRAYDFLRVNLPLRKNQALQELLKK